MIFDEKKNLAFYKSLGIGDRYAKAIDFLLNSDLASMAAGKYEIDGENVYASVQEYETKAWEDAKFEAHEHYTDIQYIIDGVELMGCAPVEGMKVKTPYNPDKDVVFYEDTQDCAKLVVKKDQCLFFFPWDAHKPKPAYGQPAPVKKVVVKIKED